MKPVRYSKILDEIRELKASRILEVGTWNGDRAIKMLEASRSVCEESFYYGFDLFEEIDKETSELEFNVKTPSLRSEVEKKLINWIAGRSGLHFSLVRGFSSKTIPFFAQICPVKLDFVWIDGGHSIETIGKDWKNCLSLVRSGGVILLDDYYSEISKEITGRFGCNQLVDKIESEGFQVELFEEKDPVIGGGFVQIVKVKIP